MYYCQGLSMMSGYCGPMACILDTILPCRCTHCQHAASHCHVTLRYVSSTSWEFAVWLVTFVLILIFCCYELSMSTSIVCVGAGAGVCSVLCGVVAGNPGYGTVALTTLPPPDTPTQSPVCHQDHSQQHTTRKNLLTPSLPSSEI